VRVIYAIAINTFREAVRDKILYAMLAFALVMLAGSLLVAELTIGEYTKIIKDLGLALISIFGLMIAVFVGIGLVYKEIERKTIYTIASKPVPRWQFLLGKYSGLVLTLAAEVAIMGLGFALILQLSDAADRVILIPAIWLTFVELMVVTAVAVLFSCFSTPTLSALFTIGLIVIGRLTAPLLEVVQAGDNESLQQFAQLLYRILPDLQSFNMRADAAYGRAVDWEWVAYSTGYGFVWTTLLLVLASAIFQYRDFK
jgi:ABC-type transport system involved in multi-copper enzyme maturation permease subunit